MITQYTKCCINGRCKIKYRYLRGNNFNEILLL
jgi:hypothetical protein